MWDNTHMKQFRIIPVLTAAVAMSTASVALAYPGQQLSSQAKITMAQARATATKTVPGKITSEELEKEDGALRYTFDIKTKKGTREVGVDAITGKVIENSAETGSD